MALPGEYLRLSFWNFDPEKGGLALLQSNQIQDQATLDAVFRIGEGCMGTAYREDRVWNEKDPRSLGSWIDIPGATKDYNGLLLVPIVWANDKIGVIAVDRTAKQEFPEISVSIAKALADIAAHAIGSPETLRALKRQTATLNT